MLFFSSCLRPIPSFFVFLFLLFFFLFSLSHRVLQSYAPIWMFNAKCNDFVRCSASNDVIVKTHATSLDVQSLTDCTRQPWCFRTNLSFFKAHGSCIYAFRLKLPKKEMLTRIFVGLAEQNFTLPMSTKLNSTSLYVCGLLLADSWLLFLSFSS